MAAQKMNMPRTFRTGVLILVTLCFLFPVSISDFPNSYETPTLAQNLSPAVMPLPVITPQDIEKNPELILFLNIPSAF